MSNNRKIYLVQILTSVSIWMTLVCCIWNVGFCQNLSPIKLGVMSFCFSGAMALFNGLMAMMIKPTKAKTIMIVASLVDIMVYMLMYRTDIQKNAIFIYIFVVASCFSIISIAKDKMFAVISVQCSDNSEKIFKLLRFLGPILGGILTQLISYNNLMVLNVILLICALIIELGIVAVDTDEELEKEETHYIKTNFYDNNQKIFRIFLVMTFIITISIQMIDAQLATVFHIVDNAAAIFIGLCIGISGIGVFFISCFYEKYFVKESFFYAGFLGMGSLMMLAGWYFTVNHGANLLVVFLMFFLGGVCWQIVMSTHENIIKSVTDYDKMMMLFTIVGILVIFSYSIGAIVSGYIVKAIGIEKLYIGIGCVLVVTAGIGCVIKKILFPHKA